MSTVEIPYSIAAVLPTLTVMDITHDVSRELATTGVREGIAYISSAPGPDYLWINGYWRWGGSSYDWTPGRWVVVESGRRYHRGRWHHSRMGWFYQEGYWR